MDKIKVSIENNNEMDVQTTPETEEEEIKQIVEFSECREWEEQEFVMKSITGKWDVSFIFLPGSCFDFKWFQFEK